MDEGFYDHYCRQRRLDVRERAVGFCYEPDGARHLPSTLLYAVYIAMYTLPMLFVPIISGAVLDR